MGWLNDALPAEWAPWNLFLARDPTDSGGTWANISRAARPIDVPAPTNPQWASEYNLFSQFSASCFYFASALTDRRRAAGRSVPPIGLIQSSIGGSKIEAWMPDGALGVCANESLAGKGQSPPGRLYNGMVAPFVNFTVSGWLWYQVSLQMAFVASPLLIITRSSANEPRSFQFLAENCGCASRRAKTTVWIRRATRRRRLATAASCQQ